MLPECELTQVGSVALVSAGFIHQVRLVEFGCLIVRHLCEVTKSDDRDTKDVSPGGVRAMSAEDPLDASPGVVHARSAVRGRRGQWNRWYSKTLEASIR